MNSNAEAVCSLDVEALAALVDRRQMRMCSPCHSESRTGPPLANRGWSGSDYVEGVDDCQSQLKMPPRQTTLRWTKRHID